MISKDTRVYFPRGLEDTLARGEGRGSELDEPSDLLFRGFLNEWSLSHTIWRTDNSFCTF